MSFERALEGGLDQLTQNVSDMTFNPGQDGSWEEATKKKELLDGSRVDKLWGPHSVVQAPLDEWKKSTPVSRKVGSSDVITAKDEGKESNCILDSTTDSDDGGDTDTSSDYDVYDFLSDGFDSDDCSHESRKKHKMLKDFFESLDSLTPDEIKSPVRQWHCPVCQGGPGAICWHRGLKNLITHARTKGSIRPRLHRGFLELLGEELRRKHGSVGPAGEPYGQKEGPRNEVQDHDIVWPAMVVVMNSKLDKCNDKGMGVQELLESFGSFASVKARHLYGPQGHLGTSLLIFESTPVGYLEAERLHKHFLELGTGREACEQRSNLCHEGGQQLYGYLATDDDVELFNQHSRGKQRVKYEHRSYSDVVSQLSEDNVQLNSFKDTKEKRCLEKLEDSLTIMNEMLKQGLDENHVATQMLKLHHPLNGEQMELSRGEVHVPGSVNATKENLKKAEHEENKKVKDLSLYPSSKEHCEHRLKEVESSIESQYLEKSMFDVERNKLVKAYEEKKYESMKRCLGELLEMVKGFDDAMKVLEENHASGSKGGDALSASNYTPHVSD